MARRKTPEKVKRLVDRWLSDRWDSFREHHEVLFCAIVLAFALVFVIGLFLHGSPADSPDVRFDLW